MNTKLHVGNVASTTTQNGLRALFAAHGNVAEVQLPAEREGGRLCGFAIVTMATPQGAQAAIRALNGKEVDAHALTVTEHLTSKRAPSGVVPKGEAPRR